MVPPLHDYNTYSHFVYTQLQFVWECSRWASRFRHSIWNAVSSLQLHSYMYSIPISLKWLNIIQELFMLTAYNLVVSNSPSGSGSGLSFGSLAQQGQSGVGFSQQGSSSGFGGASSGQGYACACVKGRSPSLHVFVSLCRSVGSFSQWR